MGQMPLGKPAGIESWATICANAAYSGSDYALYAGDALEVLKGLPDGIVNTVLTSPPYWAVRDYDHEDQLGLEEEVADYIGRLVAIFGEIYRVLAHDGTAWLNLGDTYFSKTITVAGVPPRRGWKRNKQLALVPFKAAIALQED